MKYIIEKEFTDTPRGRFRERGEHSGEEFRDDVLLKLLEKCIKNDEKLILDLDGTLGYPPSFLEEAFGGLIRKHNYTKEKINNFIEIKSEEEPKLKIKIEGYLKDADAKRGKSE